MNLLTRALVLTSISGSLLACGGSDDGGASGGNGNIGGNAAGGTNTGGANTGGANTGGANTGGANTGGANTGGANTGGANTGGANTGGANTGGAAGSNTGGAAGSNTGGVGGSNTGGAGGASGGSGGSGGGSTLQCDTKPTKSQCDACCNSEHPGGPAAMTEHIAACLCKTEFCASSCGTYCANPSAGAPLDPACESCYGSKFFTPAYQQCFKSEDAKCQAEPTCAAFGACITSCIGLP
jgi:hypothetical protein